MKGETIAGIYLEKQGYKILARNYRCPLGEIDLVAMDQERVVFVEVKTREGLSFGEPREGVGPKKMRKLSMLGLYYLKAHGLLEAPARFDVVSVLLLPGAEPQVDLIQDAFELAYGG
jgi:putative endonuclease